MADAATARIAVDLGLRRLQMGDAAGATEEFRAAIAHDPSVPESYYYLARLLGAHGQEDAARQVFALGLRLAPSGLRAPDFLTDLQRGGFDAPTTRLFYDALSETAPEIRHALTPTQPVGAYDAALSALQRARIADHLDRRWDDWHAGRIPGPHAAKRLVELSRRFAAPPPRVLLLMPEYVSCHPDFVKSTVASHALASLRELGVDAELHAGDDLCFDPIANAARQDRRSPSQARAALDAQIARFRPDIVVMDAMFTEANGALTRADLRMMKLRHGFDLIVLVTDAYPPLTNFALHWADVADLAVGLSGQAYLDEAAAFVPTVQIPCQPIAGTIIDRTIIDRPGTSKDIDFLYVGSRRRYRDLWCAHAVRAGLTGEIVLTGRRAADAPDEREFYTLLRRARLTVNSGYVMPGVDIVTFRLFEAAALGTLVLNEARAPNDACFVPYVHYVPFGNIHEMVCYARFLLEREDYRARMTEAARTWLWQHFAPRHVWTAIFACWREARAQLTALI